MPTDEGTEKLAVLCTGFLIAAPVLQNDNVTMAWEQLRNWNQELTSSLSFQPFCVNLQSPSPLKLFTQFSLCILQRSGETVSL